MSTQSVVHAQSSADESVVGDSSPPGGGSRRYLEQLIRYDVPASLVVFLVALPLSLGIAIASGAPIMAGLIAAIVGGVVAGAVGGSPLQVSGPAAGLTVVVAELIGKFGWKVTCLITVGAGILQIVFGLSRIARAGAGYCSSGGACDARRYRHHHCATTGSRVVGWKLGQLGAGQSTAVARTDRCLACRGPDDRTRRHRHPSRVALSPCRCPQGSGGVGGHRIGNSRFAGAADRRRAYCSRRIFAGLDRTPRSARRPSGSASQPASSPSP